MHESSFPAERRLQRLLATIPVSLLLSRNDGTTEFDAYTVDVSHNGLKVRTTFVLFPGDLIAIPPATDSEPAISSRVVWAQRSSSGSLAGLEFLDTLPN